MQGTASIGAWHQIMHRVVFGEDYGWQEKKNNGGYYFLSAGQKSLTEAAHINNIVRALTIEEGVCVWIEESVWRSVGCSS